MSLADDIRALRDRTFADLNAAHDYYADTITAWDIVLQALAAGRKIGEFNPITGTVTTQIELAAKAPLYVAAQLAESTFQQFISIFENFFFDILRFWLIAYPQNLSGKKVDFKAILEAPDKDAVIFHVVGREVNEILYDRPAGWFAYLEEKVKLGCPTDKEIEQIAEAKATRDVLVHHRGVANKTYEWKAGSLARHKDGERIEIPESYHRQTWELFRKVVGEISDGAVAKIT
ncbi:MAG: hypothetical protein K8T89_18185 [Planctomycetes bacterium]|nr:hypothetical protein [Planctomycetota bacterium]